MSGGATASLEGIKGEAGFEKLLTELGWTLVPKFGSTTGKGARFDGDSLPTLTPLTYIKKQQYVSPSMRWEYGNYNDAEFILSGGVTVQVKNQSGAGSVAEKWAFNLLSIAAGKQPTNRLLFAFVGNSGIVNFDTFLKHDIKKYYSLFNDSVRERLEQGAFTCTYGWDDTYNWLKEYTLEQTKTRCAA